MLQAPTLQLVAMARAVASGYRVPGYSREDLQQEAALAMLQAVPQLPFDEAECRRLKNAAQDRVRNILRSQLRKPRVLPMEGYDAAVGEGVDREVAARETLDHALSTLTPRQRQVIHHGSHLGEEDDTIAIDLGTSVTAVRVARSEAHGHIREALR